MRRLLAVLLLASLAMAAAKPRVITFGRWLPVKWMTGAQEQTAIPLKVRALMVNGEAKEFTLGEVHDVTDRLFVIQSASRLNDSLPGDDLGDKKDTSSRWSWRPGGWVMVDRTSAHITRLNLPQFDAYSSGASWYRDYVAYCGISDNGRHLYAMVVQLGRKKPLLKKTLGAPRFPDEPYSECEVPQWQKQPVRVTFQPKGGEKTTYSIRSLMVEVAPDNAPADDDSAETQQP